MEDLNKNGGGLLFYTNQDLNCKIVNKNSFPTNIEILPLVFALAKEKWLTVDLYKTPSLRSEMLK